MSLFNKNKFQKEIQDRLDSGELSTLQMSQMLGATESYESGNNKIYFDEGSLPPAELNEGRIVYVDSTCKHYYSNGALWVDNFNTEVTDRNFNKLFSWGLGISGQLGTGNLATKTSPVQEFCSATDWSQVSAGNLHSAAVKTDGTLWSWGAGTSGRLGTGNTTGQCSPVQEFCSATDWSSVSAGTSHSAAIKTDGTLWSWGNNCQGQLGAGTLPTGDSLSRTNTSPVQEFCSATDWSQVSAGYSHSAAVKTDGTLWSWGAGTNGRLGTGNLTTQCSPVQEFCSATDWSQVSAGYRHSAAITKSVTGFELS